MALLFDTHALVWFGLGDRRFGAEAFAAVARGRDEVLVSAVTAYEFADLNRRGRFEVDLPLEEALASLSARVIDYPAECWSIAANLPLLHRDPVDRMLIAHAMHADLPLVTADATIRSYPVRTIW